MAPRKAYIASIGTYLPKKVLSNYDLEKLVDTTDEWIVSRTGMKERRIAAADEYASTMGLEAAKIALQRAGVSVDQVDAIIVATLSPDYIFPSTACLIQNLLGAENALAFDIQAACTGMVYALGIAKAFIESGMYQNVLVIASEKISSILDYQDRNTCVLFGDGAAACLVTNKGPGLKMEKISLGADGSQSDLLKMPGGGCRHPATQETVRDRMHYLKMDGKGIFKHAVRRMEASLDACIGDKKIDYLVPHQANIRIIDALAKRCEIADDQVVKVIDQYGNTSASSVGLCLEKLFTEKKVEDQNHILLLAFGAGLTWGSALLKAEGGWYE